MKERIRELAEQAGHRYVPSSNSGPLRVEYLTPELEKFAELIVKECMYQVADVRIENDFEPVSDAALVQALTGIKKYFGVEE